VEIENSFMGKTKLEVLDLSGNKEMILPTSLSKASNLEVLVLDGCDGLENVVLSNPFLRSFCFDGYGAASNWAHELHEKTCRPKHPRSLVTVSTAVMTIVHFTKVSALYPRVMISSLAKRLEKPPFVPFLHFLWCMTQRSLHVVTKVYYGSYVRLS
jgi:hypothetical protein